MGTKMQMLLIEKMRKKVKWLSAYIPMLNKIESYLFWKLLLLLFVLGMETMLFKLQYRAEMERLAWTVSAVATVCMMFGFAFSIDKSLKRAEHAELLLDAKKNVRQVALIYMGVEYEYGLLTQIEYAGGIFYAMALISGWRGVIFVSTICAICIMLIVIKFFFPIQIRSNNIIPYARYILYLGLLLIIEKRFVQWLLVWSEKLRNRFDSLTEVLKFDFSKYDQIFTEAWNQFVRCYILTEVPKWISVGVLAVVLISMILITLIATRYARPVIGENQTNYKLKNRELHWVLKQSERIVGTIGDSAIIIRKDIQHLKGKYLGTVGEYFSILFMPYDMVVLLWAAFWIVKVIKNHEMALCVFLVVIVSMTMNQISTICAKFREVYSFSEDKSNIEVYRNAGIPESVLVEAKSWSAMIVTIPAMVIQLVMYGGMVIASPVLFWYDWIVGGIVAGILWKFSTYFHFQLYRAFLTDSCAEEGADEEQEKVVQKCIMVCKNYIVLPMFYFLILNCVVRMINGSQWGYVLGIYLTYLFLVIGVEYFVIKWTVNKMQKCGVLRNEKNKRIHMLF